MITRDGGGKQMGNTPSALVSVVNDHYLLPNFGSFLEKDVALN
jgi:hypothetical protein